MKFLVNVLLLFSTLKLASNEMDRNNYGPYTLNWLQFEKCKGPKLRDCAAYEIADWSNMADVIFNYNVTNDFPVTMARVTIGVMQDNNTTKKLFNYGLDKPCEHFVLGPILINAFKASSSCKFSKGKYIIHLNMMNEARVFLGPNFFYGTYNFKMLAMNKVCNFFCVNAVVVVAKKSEKNV